MLACFSTTVRKYHTRCRRWSTTTSAAASSPPRSGASSARAAPSAVTIRDVAAEAGWSSGALRHYLPTREELLVFAFRLAGERAAEPHPRGRRRAARRAARAGDAAGRGAPAGSADLVRLRRHRAEPPGAWRPSSSAPTRDILDWLAAARRQRRRPRLGAVRRGRRDHGAGARHAGVDDARPAARRAAPAAGRDPGVRRLPAADGRSRRPRPDPRRQPPLPRRGGATTTTPSGASRSARSATSRCSARSRKLLGAAARARSRARSRSAPAPATSSLNLLQDGRDRRGDLHGHLARACSRRSSATRASSGSRSRPPPATPPSCRSRTTSFDLVLGHAVLHHLPDLDRAFAEFTRVLAPGGTLFFAGEPSRHGDRIAGDPQARRARGLAPAVAARGRARPAPAARRRRQRATSTRSRRSSTSTPSCPATSSATRAAAGFEDVRVQGEELLANWFGWFNRTLEASADPRTSRAAGSSTPTAATSRCRRVDRALLEPRLPPRIFYNLMLAARKPRDERRRAARARRRARSTSCATRARWSTRASGRSRSSPSTRSRT